MQENLSEFLTETKFCNWRNQKVTNLANSFADKYPDGRERAISLFNFVRDNIKYRVGRWDKTASETLENGFGMCTTSANLLVALFRASGIPAGYCIYRVVGGESFGHILPRMIKNSVHSDSVHIISVVYLNNTWIKCDPTTDDDLSSVTRHLSKMMELVEWDGLHDAVHPIEPSHIISISGPVANIDSQMQKKPRRIVRSLVFNAGNLFIDFLRLHGATAADSKQLERKFHIWFLKNNPHHYFRFRLVSEISRLIKFLKKFTNKSENKLR